MNRDDRDTPPQRQQRTFRIFILLVIYGFLLASSYLAGDWLKENISLDQSSGRTPYALHALAVGIILYVVLLATPFVPGMEISLALLAAFGKHVALLIYAATILALAISFLIGRLIPLRLIASGFGSIRLTRAMALVLQLKPLNRTQRLELLIARAPRKIIPTLMRHRYIAIAVALNRPGNAIVGGGGGIALLAGMSGLFAFLWFVAIVALAVLPIPLAVFLIGI